ncbi:DNA (cytosine-5-)-methyltransferase, partial [Rhodovulum sulfidophilum]|nr:DNA (cytosine-5-)-methyltransferase [Rhodovulum sulfidophilum]
SLGEPQPPVTVGEAITGMWQLRSGLSRQDSVDSWHHAVREQALAIANASGIPDDVQAIARAIASANDLPHHRSSGWKGEKSIMPDRLQAWFSDDRVRTTLQHETRGHIPEDLGRYMYSAAYTHVFKKAPKLIEFPEFLQPKHKNRSSGDFADRFRTQAAGRPSTTVTSHISKDGHYFIHPDPD